MKRPIRHCLEVAPGEETAPETVRAAKVFYESVGKSPVVLKREVAGYLGNRMAAAMWREAIDLVLAGVADVEDVDKAIRLGPGLRWAVMGPHLLYHLGGGEGGIVFYIKHLRDTKKGIWQDLVNWQKLPVEASRALSDELPGIKKIPDLVKKRDMDLIYVIKALKRQNNQTD